MTPSHRPILLVALGLLACEAPATPSASTALPPPLPSPEASVDEAAKPKAPSAWVHPYRGDVQIDGMTSDPTSDVYAAGYFVGHVDFGDAHVLDSVTGNDGQPTKDVYVAKHRRADGGIEWVRHFGGDGAEGNVYDLTFAGDSVIASGAFSGHLEFDGRALDATVSAGAGSMSSGTYGNMFVAALGADGKTRWAHQAVGDVLSGGNEVAPSRDGFVQVGMFGGRKESGGTMVIDNRSLAFAGGFFDTYVASFADDGTVRWIVSVGGGGAQRGKAIASDSAGNVLVAGDAWSGETTFGGGPSFTSDEAQDFWVAKYDPKGDLLWFRAYASSGVDEVKGIAADSDGNVIVAASFAGPSLRLGQDTVVTRTGAPRTGIVFALSPDAERLVFVNTIGVVVSCCEIETDRRGYTFAANSAEVGGARGGLLTEIDPKGARASERSLIGGAAELGELSLLSDGGLALAGSFEGNMASFGDLHVTGGGGRRTQVVIATAPK